MKKLFQSITTCAFTLLITFSILILFGCSRSMNRLENIFTVGTGKGTINALAFSPDGKRLAVASSEGLWIYDTQGHTDPVILTEEDEFLALAWSDEGLASGSDSTIALWNVETKKRQQIFDGGAEALVFIGNTWIFCVTYKYKSIDGWNIRTGNRSRNYPQSIPQPREICLSMGEDSGVKNIEPGAHVKLKKPLPDYKRITRRDVPSATALAPNSIWALALKDTVSDNHKVTEDNIRITVYTHEKVYNVAPKMETPVTVMAFSTDGKFLATGGRTDTEIRLWNVKTGKLLRSLETQTNGITALAFSRDGMLANGSRDGSISLWGTNNQFSLE